MSEQTETSAPPQPPPRYSFEENQDGSAVVRLLRPVKLNGESHDRLFVPLLTGRHMKTAPWSYGQALQVGQIVTWAATVVEPLGSLDELPADIARDVAVEVVMLLGKSQTTGTPSSQP